jgi:uncharacterized protein YdeI (YjbR/CyaY-like superfamily)
MIDTIEDYFTRGCGRCERFDTSDCSARRWQQGLLALREICRQSDLTETLKWGHPCYTYHGRNIAIIGAFRKDFRLSFFNAALMQDPKGLLEKPGPETRHAEMIRFTANEQPVELEADIVRYLDEAIGYAKRGTLPPKEKTELALPSELTEAFTSDPVLSNAFAQLTPGRQRGYVIQLNAAKKPETRMSRIARWREKIIAGKGANER